MPRKRLKANPMVVALLQHLLEKAQTGELIGACVVFHAYDGSYDEVFECDDIDEMTLEMRTSVIRIQVANQCPEPTPIH